MPKLRPSFASYCEWPFGLRLQAWRLALRECLQRRMWVIRADFSSMPFMSAVCAGFRILKNIICMVLFALGLVDWSECPNFARALLPTVNIPSVSASGRLGCVRKLGAARMSSAQVV